jgi:hypothetical protein
MRIFALALVLFIASNIVWPQDVYTVPLASLPDDAPPISAWKSVQGECSIQFTSIAEGLDAEEPIVSWLVNKQICDGAKPRCKIRMHLQFLDSQPDIEKSDVAIRVAFRSSAGNIVELLAVNMAGHHFWVYSDGSWHMLVDIYDREAADRMLTHLVNLSAELVQKEYLELRDE